MVKIPAENYGKCDVYIDDTDAIGPDIPGNTYCLEAAIPLDLHIFGRPLSTSKPTPQHLIVSISKLIAEGALEDTKIRLCWNYNTRRLLLSLAKQKKCLPTLKLSIIC